METKTVKEVKIHIFLVCTCKSHDLAHSQKKIEQSQEKFQRLHDRETVTFRNSDPEYVFSFIWTIVLMFGKIIQNK